LITHATVDMTHTCTAFMTSINEASNQQWHMLS
jgi:hypothetical protein